ncbi:MAG: hypothetical protein AB4058_18405 [Microcystaceae cyanobacterium]
MKTYLANFVKQHISQEIPSSLAYCEFDCRRLNCEDCPFNKENGLSKRSQH